MTPSNRPRHVIALAAVLLTGAGLGTIPAPTQAAGTASRPELGFRIGRTVHADGTWVGRYQVGRQLATAPSPARATPSPPTTPRTGSPMRRA